MSTKVETPQSYPALQSLLVVDALHPGVISCPVGTSLRTVARMMASYRVHAILVTAHEEDPLPDGGLWGIVTDTDLVHAARTANIDRLTVEAIAAAPALRVMTSDPLSLAAELMVEHGVSHLIVVERHSSRPFGVLSTLDVARALSGS